jgi:hypothetical protein
VEQLEHKETNELVKIVSAAIQKDKLCCYCRARKQNLAGADAPLRIGNIMDRVLGKQGNLLQGAMQSLRMGTKQQG